MSVVNAHVDWMLVSALTAPPLVNIKESDREASRLNYVHKAWTVSNTCILKNKGTEFHHDLLDMVKCSILKQGVILALERPTVPKKEAAADRSFNQVFVVIFRPFPVCLQIISGLKY
jgi:hypothetical protein